MKVIIFSGKDFAFVLDRGASLGSFLKTQTSESRAVPLQHILAALPPGVRKIKLSHENMPGEDGRYDTLISTDEFGGIFAEFG